MKKIAFIGILTTIFFLLTTIISYLLTLTSLNDKICLVIGFIISIVSLISIIVYITKFEKNNHNIYYEDKYIVYKKSLTFYSILFSINIIALSFFVSAFLIYTEYNNSLIYLLVANAFTLAYYIVSYILFLIPFLQKYIKIYLPIYYLLTIILFFVLLAFLPEIPTIIFGFYLIVEVFFIFCLYLKINNYLKVLKSLTISSLSIFIVGIFVAIIILDGDIDLNFDFLDINDSLIVDNEFNPNSKLNSTKKNEKY